MSSSSSSNDVNSRIDKLESSLSRMETMMAMFLQQQGRGVVGEGQGPDLNTSIRVEGKEANSVEVEVIDKQDGKKKVMGSKRKLTPTKTEMTTPKVKRTGGGKKKVIRRGEDGDYIIDSNNNSKASTPIVGNSTAPRRGRNNITLLTCDDDDVDMNDIETLDSIRIEECDGGVNTPSAAAAGGVKDDDKEGEEHNFIPSLAYPWPSTLDDAMVTLKECNARLLNDNNNISWVTWDDIKGKEEEGQRQEEEGDLSPVGPITTAVVVADDRDEKIAEPKVEVKKDVQLEETQALEKEDEEVSLGMIFPDDDDDDGDKGYTSLSITPTTTRAIVDNDKEGGNISSGKRRARGEGAEEEKAIPQQSSSSQPTCAAGEAAVTAKDRKKEWFQSLYKSRGAKVAACRYYARGICDKGDDCEYSHDTKAISELRKVLYTTASAVPCKYYIIYGNTCTKGQQCTYSHNVEGFPCVRESITGSCYNSGCCPMQHYTVDVRRTEVYKMMIMDIYSTFIKERIDNGDEKVISLWQRYFTDNIMSDSAIKRNFDDINSYVVYRTASSSSSSLS